MVIDLIHNLAGLCNEVFSQLLVVLLGWHTWFWMRNTADEVTLHLQNAVDDSFTVVSTITIKSCCYTLCEKVATNQIDTVFQCSFVVKVSNKN